MQARCLRHNLLFERQVTIERQIVVKTDEDQNLEGLDAYLNVGDYIQLVD